MRILQFCNKIPFPPNDGGAIAMNNVTAGLISSGHQVKVLAIKTPKHSIDINNLPAEYVKNSNIELVFVDTNVKPINAFLNFISGKSYNISRFTSKKLNTKIIDILKNNSFDIIQFESIFLISYLKTFRKYSDAKIVLRAHNAEHKIWDLMAKNTKNTAKKFYLNHLAKKLKEVEITEINNVDAVYTVSKNDLKLFKNYGCKVPIICIPIGIDVTKKLNAENNKIEFPSLFHIGAMDWMPNIEAVKWFLNNVWGEINKIFPKIKFYIAGRNTPTWLLNINQPNVVVMGEVENADDFIKSKSIMIVPLLSGSGMRVKIIEGMMLGKIIISTSIGAESLVYKNQENIIIANSPKEFIEAISKCVTNKQFCLNIGENAKVNAENNYDNNKLNNRLIEFYKSLLRTD